MPSVSSLPTRPSGPLRQPAAESMVCRRLTKNENDCRVHSNLSAAGTRYSVRSRLPAPGTGAHRPSGKHSRGNGQREVSQVGEHALSKLSGGQDACSLRRTNSMFATGSTPDLVKAANFVHADLPDGPRRQRKRRHILRAGGLSPRGDLSAPITRLRSRPGASLAARIDHRTGHLPTRSCFRIRRRVHARLPGWP